MLNRFRKTSKRDEREEEPIVGDDVLQEEVKFEVVEVAPEPPEAPEIPVLSPEEQRLRDAQAALEAIKQQDDREAIEKEQAAAQEAQQRLEEAQRQLNKIHSDKDRRFHEANQRVLEAQADIAEAKRQKAIWEEVSTTLKNFQASPVGQGIPDETALVLGMMMVVIGTSEREWNGGAEIHHIAVATRDWMRRMSEIAHKIAAYHAYRKRIGLE